MAKTWTAAVMFRGKSFACILCCLSITKRRPSLGFIYSCFVCSCMYAAISVSTFSKASRLSSSISSAASIR
jgi:hypothetical protein